MLVGIGNEGRDKTLTKRSTNQLGSEASGSVGVGFSKLESGDSVKLTSRRDQEDASAVDQMKNLRAAALAKGSVGKLSDTNPLGPLIAPLGGLVDSVRKSFEGRGRENVDSTAAKNAELDQQRGSTLADMKEGDKKTVGMKAGGHVRRLGNEQEMQVEVEKRDGKYYVSRTLGSAATGQQSGVKLSAGGKLKEEFAFDSPEDAARAERVVGEQIRNGMKRELSAEQPGQAELRKRDQEFLDANRSSTSVIGSGAVEYAKKLGLKVEGGDQLKLGQGAVRGNQELEVKVNFEKDPEGGPARAKELELNHSTGLELEGELQPGGSTSQGGANAKTPGVKATGKLTVNTKMPLPEGLDPKSLLENPEQLTDKVAEMQRGSRTKLIVQSQADAGNRRGRIVTGEFEPTGDAAKDSALARNILRDDMPSLRAEPQPGKLTVKSQDYEKQGTQFGFGFDFKVVGFDGSYESTDTTITRQESLDSTIGS